MHSFLYHVISELISGSSQCKVIWKYGCLCVIRIPYLTNSTSSQVMVLIEFSPNRRKLSVYSRGSGVIEHFPPLIAGIEDILYNRHEFTELTVDIQCPHCLYCRSFDPYKFTLSHCMDMLFSGNAYVNCSGIRPIALDVLIPDITMSYTKKVEWINVSVGPLLGNGSHSRVHLGSLNGQPVAVKILKVQKSIKGESGGDGEMLSELQRLKYMNNLKREVWIMSSLRHPNLSTLLGVCTDPLVLIVELCNAGDLFTYIHVQKNILSPSLQMSLAIDIAQGMKYLHEHEPIVMHLDLKSPNILLKQRFQILDYHD